MKNMVRMECSKIYAIYLITQKNKGRYSAGIDGKTYLRPIERYELSENPFDFRTYTFQPVKIVHIPKKKRYSRKFRKKKRKRRLKVRSRKVEKKNTRPIGIMTIKDRVMAKIISFALSAKWEALFESNVMGYRPKRSVEDAIFKICEELFKGHRVILDADIKQFFDMISHRAILDKITVFHDIIERILKIPILRNGLTIENERGIIQGSPISPILANIALHEMERIFKNKNSSKSSQSPDDDIAVIRYADDFVVIADSIETINGVVKPKLTQFLHERGLKLNEGKTRVVHQGKALDFLGFHIKPRNSKIYLKPHKNGYYNSIVLNKSYFTNNKTTMKCSKGRLNKKKLKITPKELPVKN